MTFIIRWWKDLSVAKKLFAIVGTMAVLIALELFTLLFAMRTLSSVRAFVAGEGLWSKAQKNAVHSLLRYSSDHDEQNYRNFRANLSVILGDRRARIALSSVPPNRQAAREGFLEGRIEPSEIEGMIDLITRFHKNYYLAKAITAWQNADNMIDEFLDAGDELHSHINSPHFSNAKIRPVLQRIDMLNEQITQLEDQFSFTLGAGSRWLERVLMVTLLAAVITVESTGLFLTALFSRGLMRDLRAINGAAVQVGKGDFNQVLPVRSRDELGELSESINKMTQDLKESTANERIAASASEAKSLFLANMSHEIRTPLGAILGFSELMRDPNMNFEERLKYLDVVNRTGQNLTQIVNDILDLSKIEAGHLDIDRRNFSLRGLLMDLYSLLSLRASQKNLTLNFLYSSELPDLIYADPVRLRQILMNVVGNAIKFTEAGRIDLICSSDDKYLDFRVRDTGIGISVAARCRLFQPFAQGDKSTTMQHDGTGLGLVLSRRLAAAMSGNVELTESEVGQGSEFRIRIGYQAGQIATDKTVAIGTLADLRGRKILLVEDSPDNQMLVNLALTKIGALVEVAGNGQEGFDMAMTGHFDVVIMDMQMPVLDGYSATEKLRSRGYNRPIIALTAFAMKEDRDKCLRAGCTDYLSKPIDLKTLINTVYRYAETV